MGVFLLGLDWQAAKMEICFALVFHGLVLRLPKVDKGREIQANISALKVMRSDTLWYAERTGVETCFAFAFAFDVVLAGWIKGVA